MTEELWMPVVGWETLYEVSDQGRVRSLPRRVPDGGIHGGKILKPAPTRGYPGVMLSGNGRRKSEPVHQLVITAFIGPYPAGMECAHGNGNQADARLVNLSYKTPKQNSADKVRHGTQTWGAQHQTAKFTDDLIAMVHELRSKGYLQRQISAKTGLSRSHVSLVLNAHRRRIRTERIAGARLPEPPCEIVR